jgi:hypothetical protein
VWAIRVEEERRWEVANTSVCIYMDGVGRERKGRADEGGQGKEGQDTGGKARSGMGVYL